MKRLQYAAMLLAVGATAMTAAPSAMASASVRQKASHNTTGRSSRADLAGLRRTIDSYLAVPKFTAPGPVLDRAKFRGKTVLNIPDSSANPFAQGIASAEQQAAGVAGIRYINCTNQGQVTQWDACYNEAVGRRVNLIDDFGGVDPRVVGPQIQAATKAGIPVAAENVYGFSQSPAGGIKYSVPTPYEKAGQLMADWTVLDTKGKADVLVITSNEVLATAPIVAGIRHVFQANCPKSCKLTFVNVAVKDWSTKIQGDVQSALTADPKLNYVIPIYDSMSEFVIPAIVGASRVGKTFISTFNGTPFVLRDMQTGKIVRMDIGEDLQWVGWAFIDADLRLLSGIKLPSVFNEHTPLRVFTKANVNQSGVPPTLGKGYGSAYLGYKSLWRV